jgi:hypothetical protein
MLVGAVSGGRVIYDTHRHTVFVCMFYLLIGSMFLHFRPQCQKGSPYSTRSTELKYSDLPEVLGVVYNGRFINKHMKAVELVYAYLPSK